MSEEKLRRLIDSLATNRKLEPRDIEVNILRELRKLMEEESDES